MHDNDIRLQHNSASVWVSERTNAHAYVHVGGSNPLERAVSEDPIVAIVMNGPLNP